jgi:iron complex outermembrane recepter protein
MNPKKIARVALLATTSLWVIPEVANAQASTRPQARASLIEEVVVTARKREETLLSAPLTVQAITSEQIARNPASDIRSLTDMLPNVTATPAGSGAMGAYNIRGIGGANAGDSGVDQAVTLVIDNIPISRGSGASGAFFDLANIQVLPGPQALFFGKNASGGVIAFASADPTPQFTASAKAGYEFVARQRYLESAISGPLSDVLRARLAVRYDESSGWMHNDAGPLVNPIETDPNLKLQPGATDDRLGGVKTLAGRLTLVYQPTPKFTATFKGLVTDVRSDDVSGATEVLACSPGRTQPHTFSIVDVYGECKANGHTSISQMNPLLAQYFPKSHGGEAYSTAKGRLFSLKLDYTADLFSISSVSGYSKTNSGGLGNFAYSAIDYFPGRNSANDEQLSQEIRVTTTFEGPLNFIFGGYADHQKRYGDTIGRGLIFGVLPGVNTNVALPGADNILPTAIGYWPRHHGTTDTYSAFAQLTWHIQDNVTLDAGARYTKVDGKQVSRNAYLAPFYASLFAGAATGQPCNSLGLPAATACLFVPSTDSAQSKFNEDNLSPEATLSWRPTDQVTLYAAYKTGYKPGGASAPSVLLESNLKNDLTFGSEKSKGGEVGLKASLMDGKLFLITSAYYYKFNGLQLSQFDSATTSFFIRNAGSAVTKGAEVQATYSVTPELTLNGSVTYNDAYFSDYRNVVCYAGQTAATGCNISNGAGGFLQDLSGHSLANAPPWSILGGASWNHPLGGGLALGIDGDFKYSDDYKLGATGSPRAFQSSFVKFNARIRLSAQDDHWEAALIGRNLTNKFIAIGATNKPGTNNAQDGFTEELFGIVARGREVSMQLSYRY